MKLTNDCTTSRTFKRSGVNPQRKPWGWELLGSVLLVSNDSQAHVSASDRCECSQGGQTGRQETVDLIDVAITPPSPES